MVFSIKHIMIACSTTFLCAAPALASTKTEGTPSIVKKAPAKGAVAAKTTDAKSDCESKEAKKPLAKGTVVGNPGSGPAPKVKATPQTAAQKIGAPQPGQAAPAENAKPETDSAAAKTEKKAAAKAETSDKAVKPKAAPAKK